MTPFDKAFTQLLGHEGGYSEDPNDPGNWTGGEKGQGALKGTNWGISAKAYPMLDIRGLSVEAAKSIYRRDYWQPMRCDDLPPAIAMLAFDAAVNSGVAQAKRWLQMGLGVVADGNIGPITIGAAQKLATNSAKLDAALCEMQAQRLVFMAGLSNWRFCGLGWARRVCTGLLAAQWSDLA